MTEIWLAKLITCISRFFPLFFYQQVLHLKRPHKDVLHFILFCRFDPVVVILALPHYQLHIWTAFKASTALAGHVFVVTPSYPPCWTGHADMSGHHLHLPIFTRGTLFLIEVKCGLLMPLQLPKHRGRILIFSFVLCSNVVYVFPCNPHTCKYRRVLKGKSA